MLCFLCVCVRASSDLKRYGDDHDDDVIIGMGGHGEDMAAANLTNVGVAGHEHDNDNENSSPKSSPPRAHTHTHGHTHGHEAGTGTGTGAGNAYIAPNVAIIQRPVVDEPVVAVIGAPMSAEHQRQASRSQLRTQPGIAPVAIAPTTAYADVDPEQHIQFAALRGDQNV